MSAAAQITPLLPLFTVRSSLRMVMARPCRALNSKFAVNVSVQPNMQVAAARL